MQQVDAAEREVAPCMDYESSRVTETGSASMYKIGVASVAASIALAGWTNAAEADLFSAKGPVIAIVADDLFLGEAEGYLSGAGTLAVQSQKNSAVSCLGQFTSSAALGGTGQMRCSDGATATFHFQRLSAVRGHGAGSSTRGSMSFTYGLTALESESYLKLPAGKKLAYGGNKLELVDISPPQAVAPANSAVAVAQAAAPAREVAPDVLLKAVTLEVIALIGKDKDIRGGNPAKVADLVETRILPLFDFPRMTQLAVARNWRLATPEQQKALTLEFKTLLVRTYSTALSTYRDQVIEYKPLRAAPDATEVTVRSDVKQSGGERMTIDYDMEKTRAGWKVYDIKIAGVSLVTTYRSTFASKVRDGGIEGLIKALADKNREVGLKT